MPSFIIVEYVWQILRRKVGGGRKGPIGEQPRKSPSWKGLRQIEWWVQNESITKNGVLPVTTLFFWKFCFSLRTSYKELISCTNDPNAHIPFFFCKRCNFIWRRSFPVSILNVISYIINDLKECHTFGYFSIWFIKFVKSWSYHTNRNNMQENVLCATQVAGGILLKVLKYLEEMLNVFEFSRMWKL